MQRIEKISLSRMQQQYKTVDKLGKGHSGNVFLVRRAGTDERFALKKIQTSCPHKHSDAIAEIQIMKQLEHPYIVQIFKYYDETFCLAGQGKRYETGLLLELGLGSLQHCVADRGYQYDFVDIVKFIVKFIELGAYLQSKQIVHRDIKPGNIIVFGNGLQFKLADFGLSCNARQRPKGFAGTPVFCSPALMKYYNHGNHWQVANTDPYKDDVYSFALTVSEVIKHRYSLRQCPEEIRVLMDEMLKQDERERPTFRHLLCHEIVKKYLRNEEGGEGENIFKRVELAPAVDREDLTKKKRHEKEYVELDHHTQKSRKIKDQIVFSTCKGIRTICPIDDALILCGTDKGQVFVLDRTTGETVRLNIEYGYYIAKIVMDKEENIWIAGGDGRIEIISRQKLLECLKDCRQTEPHPELSFFKPNREIMVRINVPVEYLQRVDEEGEKFISDLYCLDQDHFAVGYCNGLVRVKWGKNEPFRQYTNHFMPITYLLVAEDFLYSCDFSGLVKQYSLSKRLVQKSLYKFHDELISLSIQPMKQGQNIEGVSSNGRIQTINLFKSCKTTFHAEAPVKNIIAVGYGEQEKDYFLLTSDGQLYLKNTFLGRVESGGQCQRWMCLLVCGQELLVASAEGEVCIIRLE